MTWLWLGVALAGGLGAALRHGVNVLVVGLGRPGSWATLAVNIVGSFAMGAVVGLSVGCVPAEVTTILTTGLLGGFTTFSTASAETAELWRTDRRGAAVGLAALMLATSVAAAALGWFAGSVPG